MEQTKKEDCATVPSQSFANAVVFVTAKGVVRFPDLHTAGIALRGIIDPALI